MKTFLPYYSTLLVGVLFAFLTSCTDPIGVGGDLLDEGISGTDVVEIPVEISTLLEDSLLSFRYVDSTTATRLNTFVFGRTEDPVFGVRENSVALVPSLASLPLDANDQPIFPAFMTSPARLIDSIVLVLPLDAERPFYADSTQFFFDLLELQASVDLERDYYTNETFSAREGTSLSSESRIVGTREDRLLSDTTFYTADRRSHLRIPMNEAFVRRIDNLGTEAFLDGDTFREDIFPGVVLRPTEQTRGLATLRPRRPGSDIDDGFYVYYRDSDTTRAIYRMPLATWLPTYTTDTEGALAADIVNQGPNQQLTLLSGPAGYLPQIRLPNLDQLDGAIINRAVLVLPVVEPEGYSYDDYPLPPNLGLYYEIGTSGVLASTDDRNSLGPVNVALQRRFLGSELITTEDGLRQYEPSLTIHLQSILNGDRDPVVYLRILPERVDATRVMFAEDVTPGQAILATSSAPARRALLRVTYSTVE